MKTVQIVEKRAESSDSSNRRFPWLIIAIAIGIEIAIAVAIGIGIAIAACWQHVAATLNASLRICISI